MVDHKPCGNQTQQKVVKVNAFNFIEIDNREKCSDLILEDALGVT